MRVKNKDVPYIYREFVEDAVSEYLNLPFRSKIIDRLILDLLIAMELYGFGDEMLNPIFRSLSPLKKTHPLTLFLIGLISSGLIFVGAAALSIYSGTQDWISEGWSTGIAVSLIGLFIVIFLLLAISLPFEWVQDSKTRNETLDLLEEMNLTYMALNTSGPISVPHIHERVKVASDKGVVWPASLFVLLDDITERTNQL